MRMKFLVTIAIAAIGMPLAASAQGVPGGAAEGAREGNRAAGPIGGVVGGIVGGVVGGIAGLLGVEQRPRFRVYAMERRHRSFTYDRPMAIGAILPGEGVTWYEIPAEYGAQNYRYMIVNDRVVLIDPRTREIIDVID